MRLNTIPSLVLAMLIAGCGTAIAQKALAANQTAHQDHYGDKLPRTTATEGRIDEATSDRQIAQFFYPSPSDRQGVMVQGQGEATAPADTARVVFQLAGAVTLSPDGSTPNAPEPITERSLQPIVNALVEMGVPADAIEISSNPGAGVSIFPFPIPGSGGSSQLVVKLNQPTRSRVQEIIAKVNDIATASETFSMQSFNVEYAVNDCKALERQAYIAAVADAKNRADALAEALGVQLRETPSVAESPLPNFFPFSATSSSSCGAKVDLPSFPFNVIKPTYDPTAPAEVKVRKDIYLTYPVR